MRSPFELKSLIGWLEKQPAEAEYDYFDLENCCAAQYTKSFGVRLLSLNGTTQVSLNIPCQSKPWTFGAALQRARLLDAQ